MRLDSADYGKLPRSACRFLLSLGLGLSFLAHLRKFDPKSMVYPLVGGDGNRPVGEARADCHPPLETQLRSTGGGWELLILTLPP